MRSFTREEEEVPRRKSVVLGFSLGRGSCFARARFERAFLGLLWFWVLVWWVILYRDYWQVLTFVATSWRFSCMGCNLDSRNINWNLNLKI